MKQILSKFPAFVLIAALAVTTLFSCKPKDADIQTAITEKIKAMPELAGISATVVDGVATLTGEFKDEAAKMFAENTIKGIKGVKSVVNNGVIPPPPPPPAPVIITADDPLTKSVTDAVKDFAGVSAAVKDGVVTLTGDIKRSELQKLMKSLNTLKPKKIDNQLTIK